MKHYICAVLLLIASFSASAISVKQLNTAMASEDETTQAVAVMYLATVVQTLHDMDMYSQKNGYIRNICVSDGQPMPDADSIEVALDIWPMIMEEAMEGDVAEIANKSVTSMIINFFKDKDYCFKTA